MPFHDGGLGFLADARTAAPLALCLGGDRLFCLYGRLGFRLWLFLFWFGLWLDGWSFFRLGALGFCAFLFLFFGLLARFFDVGMVYLVVENFVD